MTEKPKYNTFLGLPVFGPFMEDGIHKVPEAEIPSRGLTIQPAYVTVKNGAVVAIGQQPHVPIWQSEEE